MDVFHNIIITTDKTLGLVDKLKTLYWFGIELDQNWISIYRNFGINFTQHRFKMVLSVWRFCYPMIFEDRISKSRKTFAKQIQYIEYMPIGFQNIVLVLKLQHLTAPINDIWILELCHFWVLGDDCVYDSYKCVSFVDSATHPHQVAVCWI